MNDSLDDLLSHWSHIFYIFYSYPPIHSPDYVCAEFLPNNLSNLARLAIVYKSGGFYSDIDVIAWNTITDHTNFMAKQVNI